MHDYRASKALALNQNGSLTDGTSRMTSDEYVTLAAHYTKLAARFRDKAAHEKSPALKTEWQQMANCYFQLAERSKSKQSHSLATAPS